MKTFIRSILTYVGIFIFIALMMFIDDPELFEDFTASIKENIIGLSDNAKITDVEYKAIVVDEPNSNGKVVVTEKLTFNLDSSYKGDLCWEIWRDLPEDYVDGQKVDFKVNSVKQILPNGKTVTYEESPKLYWDDIDFLNSNTTYGPGKWYHSPGPYNEYRRRYECVFFYVDGLARGDVVFEIEYEMNNAALRYKDCSDLYLCLYSEETIKHLDSYKADILFPIKDMPSSGNYTVYTYGTNKVEFPVTESPTKHPGYYTFSIDLNKNDLKFRPHNEYIEIEIVSHGDDKHIFTDFAPRNQYYNDYALEEIIQEHDEFIAEYKYYENLKYIVLLISCIIAFFVLLSTFNTDKRIKAKYNLYKPSTPFYYFRDIPSELDPNFAAQLVFCKDKKKSDDGDRYSGILLSLVRKKYIELAKIYNNLDWTPNNVNIIIKYKKPLYTTMFNEYIKPVSNFGYNVLDNNNYETTNISEGSSLSSEEFIPYAEDANLEPLTKTEEYYYNLINRHAFGNTISIKDFQTKVLSDYDNTDSFVKNIENSVINIGINDGYFQKANYMEIKNKLNAKASTFLLLGILLTTIVNFISYQTYLDLAFGAFFILSFALIISSIYLKNISGRYILLTQFGEDEYTKWRGLYNFLNSETLISDRTVVELPLWERYLVYATAFGISDKVNRALEIRCPEIADSVVLNNSYYRSRHFHSSSRSFRSSVRSASYTSRSGGYGYGSGGRGGGGGGGGH